MGKHPMRKHLKKPFKGRIMTNPHDLGATMMWLETPDPHPERSLEAVEELQDRGHVSLYIEKKIPIPSEVERATQIGGQR